MFIKLKTCENPETENDYIYINPKYIVAVYLDYRSEQATIETVNASQENIPFRVKNTITEIMEMIEKSGD